MKKEDTVKAGKDKRLLAGTAALLLLVAAILCVAAVRQNAGRRAGSMASMLTESLENSGFSYLPGEKRELEKAAEAAAEFLDELVVTGAGRQEMIDRLQEYLLGLGWELSEEQAAELAEWLVQVYLQNYETIYGKPSGVVQTASEQSETFLEEMRTDLQSISEYLVRLDESVTNNRKELISLTETQDGGYQELAEYLEGLKSVVSTMRSELTEYRNSQSEQQVLSAQEFTDMKTRMESLSQAILELESRLKESIGNTDGNNSGRYTALQEELDGLSSDLRNQADSLNKRLSDMLSELKANGSGMNTALSELISKSQSELTALLNGLESANQLRHEKEEAQNSGRSEQINQNISEKAGLLSGRLDEVHESIAAAQAKIGQILTDMDTADSLRMEEIMKGFTGISASLTQINTDMDTAHGELKLLIETVRTEAGENQEELLSILDQIDTSFTEQNNQNFDAMVQSLNSHSEAMKAQMEVMNSSLVQNTTQMEAMNNSLAQNTTQMEAMSSSLTQNTSQMEEINNSLTQNTSQVEAMNSSLTQNTAQISAEVSGGNAQILQRLAELENNTSSMLSGLSGDVQSVFRRVSNGKKLLASALLTKNVVIDEDATFQEIYDGILKIEQEIVIGVDKIPGTVEYEYHHHTGSPESGGGCYTQASYHQHTGSCYKTCTYRESGCLDAVEQNDGQIRCTYIINHSVCTNGENQERSRWHENDGEHHINEDAKGTHLVVVCGKNEGDYEGYVTACGLQEGQITGARIVYDANAVSEAAKTYQRKAEANVFSLEEVKGLLNAQLNEMEAQADKAPEKQQQTHPEEEEETASAEAETESESEKETESAAEIQTEPQQEDAPAGTESENAPGAQPEPETKDETATKPGAEQETDSGSEPEAGTGSDAGTEQETEPEADSVTKPEEGDETDAGTEPETMPGSDAGTKPETMPESDAGAEPETMPESDAGTEQETEPETDSETKPESEPETKVKTGGEVQEK